MDFKNLIERAKQRRDAETLKKAEPFYTKTIAWFGYLGLLRHNKIVPRRFTVTLEEALKAGELEPRILELIPAILLVLPKALKVRKDELPTDLAKILKQIRNREAKDSFRGVPTHSYLHWLRAPVMDIAKRRINFHRMPRRSFGDTHKIGEFIRDGRLQLSLTQKQLADKHHLSLRIIRDLEQGKLDASIKSANEILKVFGRSLRV